MNSFKKDRILQFDPQGNVVSHREPHGRIKRGKELIRQQRANLAAKRLMLILGVPKKMIDRLPGFDDDYPEDKRERRTKAEMKATPEKIRKLPKWAREYLTEFGKKEKY